MQSYQKPYTAGVCILRKDYQTILVARELIGDVTGNNAYLSQTGEAAGRSNQAPH